MNRYGDTHTSGRSVCSKNATAFMRSAEADVICGALYGERSPKRTSSRNGCRAR